MSPTTYRSVRSLLLASIAFAGVGASTAYAHTSNAPAPAVAADADHVLAQADTLINDKQLIRARAMLLALQDSPQSATLSDEQGQRLWTMLANIERSIQKTNRLDIMLQKADLAFTNDNLVEAARQANAVISSAKSDSDQVELANEILERVSDRQGEASPRVSSVINAATTAFDTGDYAQAKTLITRIGQLGLELNTAQTRTLNNYRDRLAKLEKTRGASFGSYRPAMGMLAPESGMSTDWLMNHAEQDNSRSGTYLGQPEDEPQAIEIELVQPAAAEPAADEPEIDLLDAARRFEAQSLLGQANIAFEERRFNKALELYSSVVSNFSAYVSSEELALANDRRSQAQVQLGSQGGPDNDILVDTAEANNLVAQQADAAFNNYLAQANQALLEGDTSSARNLAAQADLTINRARGSMSESAYEAYLESIAELITQINTSENQLRISEAEAEKQRLARETAELAAERARERDAKILDNLMRVNALQQELKYEEALEVIDSILFLDPNNPSGMILKDIIEETIIYRENYLLQGDKSRSYATQSLDGQRSMIAPEGVIEYPNDWPAISFRRNEILQFADSQVNRSVLTTMRDTRMPIDFNDNPFEEVIGFIGATTNIDIDLDWESLADIGVDPDTPVTLKLRNVQISVLLDRVLAKVSDPTAPADWAVQDGILTIASDEVLRRETTLETYDIRDLLFEVPDFDNAPEFDLQQALQTQGGSPFTGGGDDFEETPRDERVAAIVELLESNVDPDNWITVGGENSLTELNGHFIVRTTPKNHRAIIGLLNKLREQRAVQINVETRFLSVNQNFFEQIGFDLDVYFNTNTAYNIAKTADPTVQLSDFFDDEGNLIDGGIAFPVGPTAPNDSFSPIRAAQDSFGLTNALASTSGFASTILNLNPALGVTGRFLDDIQVDFLVEATQADQRSVNLTAPRLTFTNGQRAFIAVVTQTTFVSDLTPVVGSGAGAFDPTITPISSGVVIDLRGVASADRRYVTLTVQTTQSTIDFDSDRDITVNGGAGGGTGGGVGGAGVPFEGTIQVPIVSAAQINTTVTIPDQGTVLLGGQRVIDEIEVETGVPVLSKIPILSRFFSNRIDSKEEKTLLVLLKPTILIQSEEEEINFPGLLDQIGR